MTEKINHNEEEAGLGIELCYGSIESSASLDGTYVTRLGFDGKDILFLDGSKIAFNSDRDGNGEIYIMNMDGSGQTRLTNNPADDGGLCFSH
ncbi:MAG: hypothetical protein WA120_01590 [Candidatus Hydromicrobium sp.]